MCNTADCLFYGSRIVRMITINNVPKFAATDVCNILGYVNANKILGRFCDSTPEYVRLATRGGVQSVRVIGIDDVRAILARSRRRNAARFRAWFEGEAVPFNVSMWPARPDAFLVASQGVR